MHEAALAQAALPAPTLVLGLVLRPFSLGHELALIRSESPLSFTVPSKNLPTKADLAGAVLICCKTWEELTAPKRDFLLGLKLALWRRRTRLLDVPEEINAFRDYQLTYGMAFRKSEIQRPGVTFSREPGCPFMLSLHEFLMSHCGLSNAEAWDHPLGYAKMRWQCFMEGEDRIELYNDSEADFDRFVNEQEEKARMQCPA